MAALESRGVGADALLSEVGLSVDALAESNRRHGIDVTTRLWRLAVSATGDPAFGLEVARHTTYQTFHALGFSLATSSTLLEALERIVRFFAIVTNAADMQVVVHPEHVRMTVHLRPGANPADEAVDAFVAGAVRLCRTLKGRSFNPARVELRRAAPDDPAPFARYFRVPVEFGAPLDALTFDRAAAEARLLTANPEIARANDAIAEEHLARLAEARLAPRVRHAIIEHLPRGEPDAEIVARHLGLGLRSLQRRLGEEGLTFRAILDDAREGLARSYLDEGRYSVSEITYLLGFAGVSAFSRAFKRWTGHSPTQYRGAASSRK